jgi:hypothetical protein
MAENGMTAAESPTKELQGDDFWSAIDEADSSLNVAEGHFKALRFILASARDLPVNGARAQAAEAAHFIAFEMEHYVSKAEVVLDSLRKVCAGRVEH